MKTILALTITAILAAVRAALSQPGPAPVVIESIAAPLPAAALMAATAAPGLPCPAWIDGYGRWRCDPMPDPFPTPVTDVRYPPPCNVVGQYDGRDICDGPAPTPTLAPPDDGYPGPSLPPIGYP